MAGARQTVLVISGPTASGKSGLALAIATQKNGCVINADSMQVYAGLPILTAQPSAEDMKAAPHALYGVLSPDDTCSAARWREMALAEISACREKGCLPIITGGTGFYLKALLQGLSPLPLVPPDVRTRMIGLQKELGNPGMHQELARRDPKTAAKLDPMNTQRNVRAMEVLEHTGKGLAEWQETPPEGPPPHLHIVTAALLPPREDLYRNCDARFDKMLAAGALDEAREFSKTKPERCALEKALGYPELSAHLAGKLTLAEAAEKSCQATRNYAKRQVTWFRNQIRADIIVESSRDAEKIIAKI